MLFVSSLAYSNPAGSAAIELDSPAAPAQHYLASDYAGTDRRGLDAAFAALGAVAGVVVIPFREDEQDRATRLLLTLDAKEGSAEDTTMREDLYLAWPMSLDGVEGVKLLKIASVAYTVSGTSRGGPRGSGLTKICKTAVVTDTGVLATLTGGVAVAAASVPGALVSIIDIAGARAVVRCPAKGASSAAAGVHPLHQRWR
jgi:hypothetical protein